MITDSTTTVAPPAPSIGKFIALTGREIEVAKFLATGSTNREIAEILELSVKTIDTHRGHILKKLGCRNNVELARQALRDGVVAL